MAGSPRRTRTSKRVRALLAAGIVVGIGATSTLAAWTDQELAAATFTAGQFGIVGSVDGSSFAEHPTGAQAAQLGFAVPATGLLPGQTIYAGFTVRTASSSAAGSARLVADGGNAAGLGAHLTYGVRRTPSAACDAAAYSTGLDVVPAGSAMTVSAAAAQPLAAAGGSTVTYCFAVSLPGTAGNGAQGLTASPRWAVSAEAT